MGRSFLASSLGLALFLLLPAVPVAASTQPPADPLLQNPMTVATGQDRGNRITLPIHIDGKGPFDFVVDTGAERTVISRELAAKLALVPNEPVRVNSLTGISQVDTVTIPRLSYGHGELPSVQAPVFDQVNLGAAGLLGLDGLESKRLMIDFRKRKMEISHSSEPVEVDQGDAIIVRARSRFGQLILVDSQANGEKINVILDTGTDQSIGNLALLRKLTRKKKIDALRPVELTSVTGETIIGGWNMIRNVRIGGFNINNLAVAFMDASPFEQLGLQDQPALLLGMDVLRQFDRVTVDFGRKRVYFLLPDGADAEAVVQLAQGDAIIR
ncbi:retroviral-like aspartic protease family protein [Rhizorhapis sp.]|uniref:retroviral-like aspartic protease family protein n=1 Tax=Rhizorhapis sp. TaxID=1968842 RepID=UPI002B474F37|nr:retroviral-like aspartic protease family protein [Rhizorhapis sp.]HKR18121.1 retroviral-like aspartic protease family protein [Rhizorhapis sp.]